MIKKPDWFNSFCSTSLNEALPKCENDSKKLLDIFETKLAEISDEAGHGLKRLVILLFESHGDRIPKNTGMELEWYKNFKIAKREYYLYTWASER